MCVLVIGLTDVQLRLSDWRLVTDCDDVLAVCLNNTSDHYVCDLPSNFSSRSINVVCFRESCNFIYLFYISCVSIQMATTQQKLRQVLFEILDLLTVN